MVDAVITYVDSSDSLWVESYQNKISNPLSNVENRFRSYGCLDLQIKLIRKNMPFVDRIFVVVSSFSQVPKEIKSLENVHIVTHSQIISKLYLPCFNSCCIEMFLHKISNLNEKFIYFNDDIFPIRKFEETDFFDGDKLVFDFEEKNYDIFNCTPYENNIINSTLCTNPLAYSYIKPTHSIMCAFKSHCKEVLKNNQRRIEISLTRTRHRKNINFYTFMNYEIVNDNYIKKDAESKYFDTCQSAYEIWQEISESTVKSICVNDSFNYDFDEWKTEFRKMLECVLNDEKYENKPEPLPLIVSDKELKVALCAIAKNENLYIREWVEWYKNIGIAHIFLYDNNELDGEHFEDVIGDYIESGFVEVIDKRGIEKGCVYDENGVNLQPACYCECYENRCSEYDWICFFDIDEFLDFRNGCKSLNEFLNKPSINNFDTILVPWIIYDDNNNLFYEKKNVIDRFTHESLYTRPAVKSIVKTNKKILNNAQQNLIHKFTLVDSNIGFANGTTNNKKIQYPWIVLTNEWKSCFIVLKHYRTKTLNEFLIRQLNRHWGTGHKYTDKKKTIDEVINRYFVDNEKTQQKCKITQAMQLYNNELNVIDQIDYNKVLRLSLDKNEMKQHIQNTINKRKKYCDIQINFDNPQTINEKLNWLKVYDILPLKSFCADKILLHQYVTYKLGKDICIPIIKIYDNVEQINISELPEKFVFKCNHGYKMNIIVDDKSMFDLDKAKLQISQWLQTDFGANTYQFHYSGIIPKCYVEQYMTNGDTGLTDYKFWCLNGEPQFVQVINDRYNGKDKIHANIYDMQWNFFELGWQTFKSDISQLDVCPKSFNEMKSYAKIFAKDFKFVRVDFYEINGVCYLGELTFTPDNAIFHFDNQYEEKYGAMLQI